MSVISCKNCGRFNRKRHKCSLKNACNNHYSWRPSPKLQNKMNRVNELEKELQQYKNLFKMFNYLLKDNEI